MAKRSKRRKALGQRAKRPKRVAKRAIVRIKHFGAGQLVPVAGGYELRIFRDQTEATALGIDPTIAKAIMPMGRGCWNDWKDDGSFTCGGHCDAGCAYWVCENDPAGGFTWVKQRGTKGTAAEARKGALCGCSDQP